MSGLKIIVKPGTKLRDFCNALIKELKRRRGNLAGNILTSRERGPQERAYDDIIRFLEQIEFSQPETKE